LFICANIFLRCWISGTPSWARIGLQLDVVVVVMIMIMGLDSIAIFHIYTISKNTKRQAVHIKAMRRLAVYPVVYFLVWLPTLINRVQNAADPSNPSFGLYFFQALMLPLQGFMNAIVYGVNEKLVQLYRHGLKGKGRGEGSSSSINGETPPPGTIIVA